MENVYRIRTASTSHITRWKVDLTVKYRIAGLLAACLVVIVSAVAWADNTFEGFPIVRVVLNQQEVTNDVPAILFNGRTMLPLRKIAELAGLTVERWDGETNTVYLSGGAATPVATVNGEPITQAHLYTRLAAQNGSRLIDEMITEKLVDQAARKANITVTDLEIDAEIARIKANFRDEQEFQMALRNNNLTLEQLREYQVQRVKLTKLLLPSIPVTDQVLKQYFEANRAQFDRRQVHARHILVATQQEAQAIKAELDKGADFAVLAKAKSIEPAAKTTGGDLGTFGAGQMVPEFERVVFSLPKGAISAPFQTPFGWHIAQVLETTGTAPDFAAIKADVRDAYIAAEVNERAGSFLAGLRAKAQINNTFEQK
jgi:foldase protein PrsA